MEIHTGFNDLQEKYKPTFSLCTASCVSNTFSYQNFQVQAVVNWFSRTASLWLTENRVQHSKGNSPGLTPKMQRSRERFFLTSGRLDKAVEDVYKNKSQGKKKCSLSNTERKINIAEALCSTLNTVILIGKQVAGWPPGCNVLSIEQHAQKPTS